MLRPKHNEVADLQRSLNETEHQIRQKGWPVDPAKLRRIQRAKHHQLAELEQYADTIAERIHATFADRLTERFPKDASVDPTQYVSYMTRLDYEEDFAEISSALQKRGIILAEEVLRLSENSVATEVYQLIFQLWSLETIVQTALDHNLVPARTLVKRTVSAPTAEDPKATRTVTQRASQITVKPILAYVLDKKEQDAYILEFPIAMTVHCDAAELAAFLKGLHTTKQFIPVNHIQIRKLPPNRANGNARELEVDLECSTFLRLKERLEIKPEEKQRVLPAGA
ncbi:MAG: hypothetical protein K9N51_11645 [Candidatus Pacebacteria bacterium]|nr:hypothetical protein [Candidatus Paceibacterota bacterium]